MAKKEEQNTNMQVVGGRAMQVVGGSELIAGRFDDPNKAFAGLEAEMFPVVWNFKNTGEYIDATVIAPSAPVTVNDEWEGERDVETWELAISQDFRIRVMESAQLAKMLPELIGLRIRLVYVEQVDVKGGARRVKVFRAARYKDQSASVTVTASERQRYEDYKVRKEQERVERNARAAEMAAERRASKR